MKKVEGFGVIEEPYLRQDILLDNRRKVCGSLWKLASVVETEEEAEKCYERSRELQNRRIPIDLAEQDAFNAMLQKQLDEVNEQLKHYE